MSEKGDGGIRGEMKSSGGKTKGYGEDGGWCGGWGVRVMWKKGLLYFDCGGGAGCRWWGTGCIVCVGWWRWGVGVSGGGWGVQIKFGWWSRAGVSGHKNLCLLR